MGIKTVSRAYNSLTIGMFNDSAIASCPNCLNDDSPLFYIGNGTANTSRHNAMVVYQNGNTEISGALQVGSGNKFSKMQGGSVLIGNSATVLKSASITFLVSFDTVPGIVCTVVNDDPAQPNVNDTWVVSVRNISATGCTVNVVRVDASLDLSTQAKLSWFAFTN